VAVLLVELPDGADQPHGRFASVHDGYALEHLSDPLSVKRPRIGAVAGGLRKRCPAT
jgi:hypothetical protein